MPRRATARWSAPASRALAHGGPRAASSSRRTRPPRRDRLQTCSDGWQTAGRADRLEMAVVGAATATQDAHVRMPRQQRAVLARKLAGVACVEIGGLVELGVASPRSVGAQAANALDPGSLRLEHAGKV